MHAKVDERGETFASRFRESKNDLRDISNANFDLPEGTKLYINETFCLCCVIITYGLKSFVIKA